MLLLAVLLAGCSGKVVDLGADREKLDQLLAREDKPVLVDFWKWGCASCMSIDPLMDQLAQEYDGRVVVAKFWTVHFWLAPTDWKVFRRYNFGFFPTVILFSHGQELDRWVWNLDANAYRKVLDPIVPPPPATQPAVDKKPPEKKPQAENKPTPEKKPPAEKKPPKKPKAEKKNETA